MSYLAKSGPPTTVVPVRVPGAMPAALGKVLALETIAGHLTGDELTLLAKAVTNPAIKLVALEKLKNLL